MCWSLRVTLVFVVLETAGCAVLFSRGHRLLLLALGPLVLQEAAQCALWQAIERDEAAGGCSASNGWLTALELFLVCWLLGVCGARAAILSLDTLLAEAAEAAEVAGIDGAAPPSEAERLCPSELDAANDADAVRRSYASLLKRSRSYRWALRAVPFAATLFVAFCGGLWGWGAASQWEGASWCSSRGSRGGHQLWPWVQPPLPPSIVHAAGVGGGRIASIAASTVGVYASASTVGLFSSALLLLGFYIWLWAAYMAVAAFGVACVFVYGGERLKGRPWRHGWLGAAAVLGCGPSLVLPFWVLWGAEFGSVWCWSASTGLLTAILEPALVDWAARRYDEAVHASSSGSGSKSGRARHPLQWPLVVAERERLWRYVIGRSMTPTQRLQDSRAHGPLSRGAADETDGAFRMADVAG